MVTYRESGVSYEEMDPWKRMAQIAARETDRALERFVGYRVVEWSRGESVFLIEAPFGYLGFLVEGLGTKSLVADLYRTALDVEAQTSKTFYDQVAQCNVAMALNDLITLGVSPLVYGQYAAVGDSAWFADEARARDTIEGTKNACIKGRAVWGGGETPTLKGIIYPETIDLAGATFGVITPKHRVINPENIRDGDVIVLVKSSGIHANGLSMARKIADKLPQGYLTRLADSRTFGESLLDPTHIYVGFIEGCLNWGLAVHYTVNVTGHGWRKLMRAREPFTYVIDTIPQPQPVFDFMQEHGPVDDREAYGNLNMGAGFALFVGESDADLVVDQARGYGFSAFRAGRVVRGPKRVEIVPKNIVFTEEELAIR